MTKKKQEQQQRSVRVLVLADAGTAITGFGGVIRNILHELVNDKELKLDIDQVGINFSGDFYDMNKFPYRIYPALAPIVDKTYTDLYGRQRIINALLGRDPAIVAPFDILFTLQDPFIMEGMTKGVDQCREAYKKEGFNFKWIAYYPADGAYKENWSDTVMKADYPVMYTEYGKNEVAKRINPKKEQEVKDKVGVIYHGTNTKEFFPVGDKEKKEFRQKFFVKDDKPLIKENTFLVTNVNRNQIRKDIMRSMKVFKEFKKMRPDSMLYLHMKNEDAGGTIKEYARRLNMVEGEDYILPAAFNESRGYPVNVLNMIYNVSDLVMTTTLGEGWGLSITEAMSTKTPVIAPHHTSIPELFGTTRIKGNESIDNFHFDDIRGIPIKTDGWFCQGRADTEQMRPLTDEKDMINKMIWAYDNPDKCKKIAENAYKWVVKLKWSKIGKEWKEVFKKAIDEIKGEYAANKAVGQGTDVKTPKGGNAKDTDDKRKAKPSKA